MANPLRAFSLLGFGAVAAAAIAWSSGELQRFGLPSPMIAPVMLTDLAPQSAKAELSALTKAADGPANPVIDQLTLAPTRIPVFDIVRVQPDGSMVIAGRAAAGAAIDIIASGRIIGQTSTDESGSFAFVLDQPLAAGDYEIGLSAKIGDELLLSEEKAIVQIPELPSGDVLAIVTAPDKASEILAAGPLNSASNEALVAATAAAPAPLPVAEVAPKTIVSADPVVEVAPAMEQTQSELKIEAVEIDGIKTFIAGSAPAGTIVRLYVGEMFIGEAKTNDGGRFLVESKQPVPVGMHTLRADGLGANGEVLARASVPFERVKSENLAAIAPAANSETKTETQAVTSALTRVDTSVIIRKGDTLWQIARRVYGKGVTFSTIYNANLTQITNPDRIWPGQVFSVPQATETGDPADFMAIDGQKKTDVVLQ